MCEDKSAVQHLERSLGSRLVWARKFEVRACVHACLDGARIFHRTVFMLYCDNSVDFRFEVQFPPNFIRSFALLTLSIACTKPSFVIGGPSSRLEKRPTMNS